MGKYVKSKWIENDETGEFDHLELEAAADIPKFGVRKGTPGGWIASEDNFPNAETFWVGPGSKVMDDAKICDDTLIDGESMISDYAIVGGGGTVVSNSVVNGFAKITDGASVYDSSIDDRCVLKGQGTIVRNAELCGNVTVFGGAQILGWDEYPQLRIFSGSFGDNALVRGPQDFCCLDTGWGSFTVYASRDDIPWICAYDGGNGNILLHGTGTVDEFFDFVSEAKDGLDVKSGCFALDKTEFWTDSDIHGTLNFIETIVRAAAQEISNAMERTGCRRQEYPEEAPMEPGL